MNPTGRGESITGIKAATFERMNAKSQLSDL